MMHGGKVFERLRTAGCITLVIGMFLGSLYAGRRTPRKIRIAEIRPLMSFSKVSVQGMVASAARILNDGTGFCLLADETGSLPLFINRVSGGEDLRAGSCITATGCLGLGTGNRACLRVPDADHIDTLQKAVQTCIRGRVIRQSAPPLDSRAPYRMLLERPEGRIEAVHWFRPKLKIAAGDRVEVKGTLGFYRGRLQVKVRDAGDIRLQPGE
jgi:DNA/RNA endonuclease YhcR with UshA esterase domain